MAAVRVVAGTKDELLAQCPPGVPVDLVVPDTGAAVTGFTGCSNIVSVTLAVGVTTVGESAFTGCTGLTAVVLPGTVKKLGDYAFGVCTSLVKVVLTEGLCTIGEQCFGHCTHLAEVSVPASVTHIGEFAFSHCPNLLSVVVATGSRVNAIEKATFRHCVGLRHVQFGPNVQRVAAQAFQGCTRLGAIDLPCVKSIGRLAFSESGLTSVRLPDVLLEPRAFANCERLVVATLSKGALVSMAFSAECRQFSGCPQLQLVVGPSSIDMLDVFEESPNVRLVEDSPAAQHRASGLRFWSRQTHHLCSPSQKAWVLAVLLVAGRLRRHDRVLPTEMWLAVLNLVLRHELGAVP
eukprot:m.191566 g.191566  ORF g.191566 m.191566 type:complete len:349 (-) comp15149_c0_seq3:317-1363(-)